MDKLPSRLNKVMVATAFRCILTNKFKIDKGTSALVGNYDDDGQTNQPTNSHNDRPTETERMGHREITLTAIGGS